MTGGFSGGTEEGDVKAVRSVRRVHKSDRGIGEPCLPGFAVQRLDGLFFSIFPDRAAAVRTANNAEHFRRAYGLMGAPLLTDRFHVSVQGLGNYDGLPRSIVAKAIEAGAAVTSRPFEVAFDRVASFAGSDALVLCGGDGVDGIVMLHHALGAAMRKSGLSAGSQFTPDITLLYDGRRIEEQFVEPIRWTVRNFVLVHSWRGRTMHIPLERWRLGE
jgi:RNA 2',3'-cyclic 3'-phosphodiesterase